MSRYIDADELYKATQKRIAEANEARMAVVDDEFLDLIDDAFTEDVVPRAEWISVEERLPEKSCEYLCVSRTGMIYLMQYSHRYKAFNATDDEDGDRWKLGSITHWMPLPEPPKEKQPKNLENFEKKRLLPGDCFHGEIWYMCPYCLTGIEAHSIPKDRICHKCGKEYL